VGPHLDNASWTASACGPDISIWAAWMSRHREPWWQRGSVNLSGRAESTLAGHGNTVRQVDVETRDGNWTNNEGIDLTGRRPGR